MLSIGRMNWYTQQLERNYKNKTKWFSLLVLYKREEEAKNVQNRK